MTNDLQLELGPECATDMTVGLCAEKETSEATRPEKFVAFFLGESLYGIPVERVSEVVNLPSVARLPNSPKFLSGITTVRGEIVAVLNLKAITNEQSNDESARAKLVVLQALPAETRLAFPVDRIHEIVSLDLVDMGPRDPASSRHIAGSVERSDGMLNIIETRFLADELVPAP